MKKNHILVLILFICALLFTFNDAAVAFTPRLNGMALDADTYWMVHRDEELIFMNPAILTGYGQFLWVGWTDTTTAYNDGEGGINFKPMDPLSIYVTTHGDVSSQLNSGANPGDMFNYTGYALESTLLDPGVIDPTINQINTEMINVTIGYKMGAMSFGAILGYAAVKDADSTAALETDYNRSQMRLRLGFNMDMGGGSDLDAALEYRLLGIDNKYTVVATGAENTYKDDGANSITALVRYNAGLSEASKLHLFLSVLITDYSTKLEYSAPGVSESDTLERKGNRYLLGASNETKTGKDVMVFYGIMIGMEKSELNYSGESPIPTSTPTKTEYDSLFVPITFGLEGKLTERFTVRLGATHRIYDSQESKTTVGAAETKSESLEDNDARTRAAIGLTFKEEKFTVEWELQKGLLIDGPYIIGGVVNAGFATSVAISYLF